MVGLPDYVIISLEEWAKLRAIYMRVKDLKENVEEMELGEECRELICGLVSEFSEVISEIMIQPAIKRAMKKDEEESDVKRPCHNGRDP